MIEIDSIIQKYLHRQTSEKEDELLYQWMQQSEENKKHFFSEKDIWDTLGFHFNQKKYDVGFELELLKQSLNAGKPDRTISLKRIIQIAAVLLVTFGLGWGSQFISFSGKQKLTESVQQRIYVPKGQVNQVFLADGTRIWLNSESELTVPSLFNTEKRVVQLKGEAFFEVAKDKKHPFQVELNGQVIEVVGTSFNVRAYDNLSNIETTLETGRIILKTANKSITLHSGEQSLYNKVDKHIQVSKVDPKWFSTWKEGRYEFKNENLIDVFKVVERWYDVEIITNEAYFKDMHFSGVIKRNKDVKHFLELLDHTIPIRYKIVSDKITISPK